MKHASKDDQIEQIERRLEVRRERLHRHFEALRTDVSEKAHRVARSAGKAVGWVPIAAVAGGLAVGFAASRYPRRRNSAQVHMPPAYAYNAQPQAYVVQPTRPARSRNFMAALLGIAATTMRLASSHELRTMWSAVRKFRERRR